MMNGGRKTLMATGADPALPAAGLTAGSIARELSPPVAAPCGLLVDTGQPDGWIRWVSPALSEGPFLLGRSIAHFMSGQGDASAPSFPRATQLSGIASVSSASSNTLRPQ